MRGNWEWRRVIGIGIGGATGAALRWAVVTSVSADGFPWPVLALNVAGSMLLGAVLAGESLRPRSRLFLHDAGAIGFCGGLTTFSTFSLEVVDLTRDGDAGMAAAYVVASVVTAIAGVLAGAGSLRRVRAVTLPVEEAP